MPSPLSRKQKASIAQVAADAFRRHESLGVLELPTEVDGLARSARCDWWRRNEIGVFTQGRTNSLRACTQDDYLPLTRHFLTLAGRAGDALRAAMKEESTAACYQMPGAAYLRDTRKLLQEHETEFAFVAGIVRQRFGHTDLERLTTSDLFWLLAKTRERLRERRIAHLAEPRV